MTLYTRGFSHFVTSMTAPIASGRSDSCRVGLAPTEERRLVTAHTHTRIAGTYAIRFCVGQTGTAQRHVDAAWRQIRGTARSLPVDAARTDGG